MVKVPFFPHSARRKLGIFRGFFAGFHALLRAENTSFDSQGILKLRQAVVSESTDTGLLSTCVSMLGPSAVSVDVQHHHRESERTLGLVKYGAANATSIVYETHHSIKFPQHSLDAGLPCVDRGRRFVTSV